MPTSRTRPRRAASLPLPLIPPAAIGAAFLVLPAVALLIRAPWRNLFEIYRRPEVADALRISILTATEATVLSVLFGVPLSWVLARVRFPGRGVLRAAVMVPLVLPPVVGGVVFFLALGAKGVLGRYLDEWFGITLPFTQHGIVLVQVFVSMPFLVLTVEGAFRTADRNLEEAAATLGANRSRIFGRVTLPLILPSLAAGTVLCWARSLGEYGATQLFGGNIQGRTQTMPTLIYQQFNSNPEDAVALSLLLMLVAVVLLASLRDKWLRPVPSA
jgi:molybdate transport system permease protein